MTARRRRKARTGGASVLSRVPHVAWMGAAAFVVLATAGFLAGRSFGTPPGSDPYRAHVLRWCTEYNVNPDMASAVIDVESSGRPRAVSSSGALGLMQLMPKTAGAMAKELGLEAPSKEDIFEPALNIRLGVYYLSKLRRRFGEEKVFVIAAYHAGPTRVDRWRTMRTRLPAARVIEEMASSATRAYVRKVLARWKGIASG